MSHEVMYTRHIIEVNIAKSSYAMLTLLLQKPSKSLKAKEHFQALERLIKLWDEGSIKELLYEGLTIEQRLRSDKEGITIVKISLKLNNLMSKGNVSGTHYTTYYRKIEIIRAETS